VLVTAVGIFITGFSSILTGLNFIVTIHTMRALKRMAELGRERLAQGFWIAIFRKEHA